MSGIVVQRGSGGGSGSLDIVGLTAGDVAVDDLVPIYDLSATANRKLTVERLHGIAGHVCEGRLTLATGKPTYFPTLRLTPSSTDTSADTTTFAAAHGWVTGTIVIPSGTGGGLTSGGIYFINVVNSTTISYHTTLADALAGSAKVDLTASITTTIVPSGIQNSTLYFTPFNGDRVRIYDGTRWKLYTFTERSLALSSLTSGKNYDVFIYDSSGTLTLELSAAWTDDNNRADALTTQDGVYVKSGTTTRLYLGTIRTVSTSAVEVSWGLGNPSIPVRQFLWNNYNQVVLKQMVADTGSHTYNSATVQEWNGATTLRCQFVVGMEQITIAHWIGAKVTANATTDLPRIYVNLNGISPAIPDCQETGNAAITISITAFRGDSAALGYNYATLSESEAGTTTATFVGGYCHIMYMG